MTRCSYRDRDEGLLAGRASDACKDHFITYFENKVFSTVQRFAMIKKGSKPLIALSGGKDSASLLYSVCALRERLGIAEVRGVFVDEGISHRTEAAEVAQFLCRELGVPLITVSFLELYRFTVNQVVSLRGSSENTCSYCGVLRRRALEIAALREGCDVVLTGHNLDDLCQTYIMNMLRNEPARLHQTGPRTNEIEGFVPRRSPLARTCSSEIRAYVQARALRVHEVPCPHRVGAFRYGVMRMVAETSSVLPDFERRLIRSVERELATNDRPQFSLKCCSVCSFPSKDGKCRPCRIVEEISKQLGA